MKKGILVLVTVVCVWLPEARGQGFNPGVVASTGFSQPNTVSGATNSFGFAAGGSLRFWRLIGLATLDTSAYSGLANPRYYKDAFSNGQSRCRDSITGQFANDTLCGAPLKTISAGMFDVNAMLRPLPLTVGAGYRYTGISDDRGAYISFGYTRPLRTGDDDLWFVRSNIGAAIVQFQVGIVMHWRQRQ